MTKELQDHVWSILPKEFKEEVKKEYKLCSDGYRIVSASLEKLELRACYRELEDLFGIHNLTSDADELRKNGYEELSGKRLKLYKLTAEVQFGKEANFQTKKPKPAEPKEDKHFDNILKDSFRDHNRLHIAAMMVPSVIATVPCSENEKGYAKMVATRARILADALISECNKGGKE